MKYTVIMMLICAIMTYAIRMTPLVLVRKKISSRFVNDCLYYIPYAVLAAMTVPQIFYSAGDFLPSAVGTFVAVVLAFCNRSLITVAMCAAASAYITSLII